MYSIRVKEDGWKRGPSIHSRVVMICERATPHDLVCSFCFSIPCKSSRDGARGISMLKNILQCSSLDWAMPNVIRRRVGPRPQERHLAENPWLILTASFNSEIPLRVRFLWFDVSNYRRSDHSISLPVSGKCPIILLP